MSTIVKWTPEVIQAARSAAVAVAEFWDALRELEVDTGFEFEGTLGMIDGLASNCDAPPSFSDLKDEDITAHLDELEISGGL
jgi:hypothetical protein